MFNVDSSKIVLINLNDNKIIYELNADEKTEIASLTKIMTAILTIENQDLESVVKITTPMIEGLEEFVVAGLKVGQELTVEELLYLALLPSDGDAAQALAIKNAGTIEDFAKMMNEKAIELGMTNTHFSNPVGLDTDNYSTARDIATLLKYAIGNPTFKKIFESFEYYSPTLDKKITKTIYNNGVISGAKTGFTYAAGRCLASTATLNDVNYLLVNLNANWQTNNHVRDALTIYDYYSSNYGYKTILENGEKILDLEVHDSDTKNLEIYAKEEAKSYLKNDFDIESLVHNYEGAEIITNKNKVGDWLGHYSILKDDEVLYETEIYLETEIDFYPYWLWNTGVVMGVATVIAVLVLAIRRRRKQVR